MKRCRFSRPQIVIWLLSVCFVVATGIWIVTFPFCPSLVLRVIPSDATLVSWHLRPADRVDAVLRSAPASLLLAGSGISVADAQEAIADPGVQKLMNRLAGRGVVLGFSPEYGQRQAPAVFVGSWVGGLTTHFMRGGWLDDAFAGFSVHQIGRDRIWTGMIPELPPGMQQVSFGVYEGVLAGCASSDPLAALPLLRRLRRHGPLAPLAEPLAMEEDRCGHVRFAQLHDAGGIQLWSGAFDVSEEGQVDGHVKLENSNGSIFPEMPDRSVKTAGPFPLDIPAAVVAVPWAQAMVLGERFFPAGSRERELMALFDQFARAGADSCACVTGGAFSGRFMRMRVPCVAFALQVKPHTAVSDVASQLTDRISAHFGYGLIALPDRKDPTIQVLQPIRDRGGFAFPGADERPALVVKDDWLIIMSNVAVLRRMLALDVSPAANTVVQEELEPVWLYGKMRLPALGELTGNALAGYALMRLMQTGKAERLDTPMVKGVLDGMRALGEGHVRSGLDSEQNAALFFTIDGRREVVDE